MLKLKILLEVSIKKFISNDTKGRTSEMVRKVNFYLSSCIKNAIYDSYIKKNPRYNVKAKGTKQGKKKMLIYLSKFLK